MAKTGLRGLVNDLGQAIGTDNVAFDEITRWLYSTDASNYQILPIGVTFPRHADDVCAIHEIATQYQVPILPRGGGTGLAGQTLGHAVVIDFTRHMRRVQAVNADTASVQVETGMVLDHLNQQLQGLDLMFGPDPASGNRATIGGCLGNNATGTHSILYRMTADHVRWVDVVLATGEKIRLGPSVSANGTLSRLQNRVAGLVRQYQEEIETCFPQTWRTVAGYALNRIDPDAVDLAQLVIGAEGTLGSIVSAELGLVRRPHLTYLAIIHFDRLDRSLESVPAILETEPSAVELLDKFLLDRTRDQPEFARYLGFVRGDPRSLLAVEFYGETETALESRVERLKARLHQTGHRGEIVVLRTPQDQAQFWIVRKAGLGLLSSNRSDWKTLPLIEDAAVPVEHLADYIARIDEIVADQGAEMAMYAHASAGCLHVRPMLNLKTAEGLRQYRAIGEAAVDAVMAFKGTISGEHGLGIVRGEFTERFFGPQLTQAFREVKALFDPDNLMNPNQFVDPLPMDDPSTLRYGPEYKVPLELVDTRFDWIADHGFAGAIEMCNGAGVCRKEQLGTMCPSFMATREERDSTRGRANILRLALSGVLGMNAMNDERVREVLDLCLSCKGCKAECPSAVDMARIKAEFMAAYYDHHRLPLCTWLFGNVHRIAQLGSLVPILTNMLMELPVLSGLGKRLIGVETDRQMPKFASQRFSRWWKRQLTTPQHRQMNIPILLIDTYTEYYHPEIGRALDYLMTQSGLSLRALRLPGQGCCGRPAMSKGMLDQAKAMANRNVEYLAAIVDRQPDTRFMMLEPSCLSALRDDYPALVEKNLQEQARTLASCTISVEEWLDEWREASGMDNLVWDKRKRKILVHGHCHQKALWGTAASLRVLKAIPGAHVSELPSGCCGMAGSFGYEHYDVSMKVAELHLYPAVREHPDAIIAASGESCRQQVEHIQGNVKHPVQIIAEACGWKP